MQKLLIVEDEKMIRQGIATMAKRTSVPIEEIIQCKNGVEALEIIESMEVDAVLTDIRMPKMDGIELVEKLSLRENPPQIAVISGFDDFNYAVSMIKFGAVDYLLKPVKREKIEEVLIKMNENISHVRIQEDNKKSVFLGQLKSYLKGETTSDMELEALEKQFRSYLQDQQYQILVTNDFSNAMVDRRDCVILKDIYGQQVLIGISDKIGDVINAFPKDAGIGISKVYHKLSDCRGAYEEAFVARKQAFIKGIGSILFKDGHEIVKKGEIPEHFCEQFIQKFPTDKYEYAHKELLNLYFHSKHDQIDADQILACIDQIQRGLQNSYPQVVEEYLKPLSFSSLDGYIEKEKLWMIQMRSHLKEQFDTDKNQEKIHQAIDYIKKNYRSDLNMAMVSNHVSMNYSLFSIAFKEYTGVNFVNYLKIIRIDEAKRLLTNTDDKILDISRQVGYENEKHFMKTFKRVCGVSPSEYRKNSSLV